MENSMEEKQCASCGKPFHPLPQIPQQTYCSAPDCQRERRRRWLQSKLQSDPDYQDNQTRAQQAWSRRNPGYWRKYRESHPRYVERNRALQHDRNAKTVAVLIANMDASNPVIPLLSGIYHLSLITDTGIAKMDVWKVEITVHTCQLVSGI
jgi:hypothetical protein